MWAASLPPPTPTSVMRCSSDVMGRVCTSSWVVWIVPSQAQPKAASRSMRSIRPRASNRPGQGGLERTLTVQLPPGKDLVRVHTMAARDGCHRCAAHMCLLHNPALLFNGVLPPRPRPSAQRVGRNILLSGCVHVALCGHLASRAHVGNHGQRQSDQLLGNPRTVTAHPKSSNRQTRWDVTACPKHQQ